jgi:cytochrome c-type biogenesis protein
MNEWVSAFTLGSAAILTNACLLPLYPGLIAFLAGSAQHDRASRVSAWLGLFVLAGVLLAMLIIGLILYLIQTTFGTALQILLPIVYAAVIGLGLLMLSGRNPFARLSVTRSPVIRSPYGAAFAYGLLLSPMTLPCTGPIITSAFLLGAQDAASLAGSLAYFLFFGLGFGWPLVILPLIALPVQRQIVGWLGRNHRVMERASGILLVAVGLFGIFTELVPQYAPTIEIPPSLWLVYWAATAALIAFVSAWSLRRRAGA